MDTERLDQLLTDYTARLEETRPDEVYKWDAIMHFRDTFDLSAQDLAGNLKAALSKTFGKTDDNRRVGELLGNGYWHPKRNLIVFAQAHPDQTREALGRLLDEDASLYGRMVVFDQWATEALDEHDRVAAQNGGKPFRKHDQDARAMSVYLTFHNTEAHYLYKWSSHKPTAKEIGVACPTDKLERYVSYRQMCDEMAAHLERSRPEVIAASDALLTDEQRAIDPMHHLLVQDLVYFIDYYVKQGGKGSGAKQE